MQVFGDMSANGKLMAVVIIVIVLVAVLGLGLLVFRISGRRLTAAGSGRTRQPRLGVVDAYDLDRQRQLVIVRRDNVEHLLMIGGPNDLLVESAIVRAAAAAPTLGLARDKEPAVPGLGRDREPIAPAIPVSAPAPSGHVTLPLAATVSAQGLQSPASTSPGLSDAGPTPPAIPIPPRPTADQPTPAVSTSRPASPLPPRPSAGSPARPLPPGGAPNAGAPPKPTFPPASRPLSTPRPATATPLRQAPPPGPAQASRTVDAKKPDDGDKPTVTPNEPVASTAEKRTAPEVSIEAAPVKEQSPPRVRPEPRAETPPTPRVSPLPPLRPISPPAPPTQPNKTPPVPSLDALESLEEEMAKLLGRPAPPAEKL